MGTLLALCSAAAWGAGDFLGGLAARRAPALAVAFRAHAIGLAGLLVMELALVRSGVPDQRALAWGALAGLAGGVAIWLFYRSLAVGTMSVVAPVSGVTAAVVPVVVGLASGERPGTLAIVGIGVALTAIALVGAGCGDPVLAELREDAPGLAPAGPSQGAAALEPSPAPWRTVRARSARAFSELAMAVASGVGFGLFAVGIQRAGDDAGLWPLVAGRAASVSAFGVALLLVSRHLPAGATIRWLVVATAVLDTGANALFMFAAGRGLLSIVGTVVALYPATTVILARAVLHERLARCQQFGLGAAVLAVVLVAGW